MSKWTDEEKDRFVDAYHLMREATGEPATGKNCEAWLHLFNGRYPIDEVVEAMSRAALAIRFVKPADITTAIMAMREQNSEETYQNKYAAMVRRLEEKRKPE